MLQASTFFVLLAEFGAVDVELTRVCQKYFGVNEIVAKKHASMHKLPVPAYRGGSQKSPWLVSIKDLADYIDRIRQSAAEEWTRCQLSGTPPRATS